MSIKDYTMKLVVINGATNDRIAIPNYDDEFLAQTTIQDYILLKTIKQELANCESIVITKSYMKD